MTPLGDLTGSHHMRGFAQKWLTDPQVSAQARSLAKEGFAKHYRDHDPSAGAGLFTQAIKLAPKCGSLYKERANCYIDANNYKEAISDLTTALQYEADDFFALRLRAFCYCMNKQYKLAIDDYSAVLAKHPEDRRAYGERAKAEKLLGNAVGAQRDVTKAQQLSLPLQAQWLVQNGKFDEGLAAIDQAIASANTEEQKWDFVVRRANLYVEGGKYKAAEGECGKLLNEPKLLPFAKSRILLVRGDAYMRTEEFAKATADYATALKIASRIINPEQAKVMQQSCRIKLGLSYFEQCKYSQAIADYSQAIKLREQDKAKGAPAQNVEMMQTMRSYWQWQHKQFSATHTVHKHGQPMGNERTSIFSLRGDAYMMSGAYDKALADYETAHLDVPDDVHCLYEGSLAAEKLGKLSKSVQICTELIKLSPNTSDFYLRRGDLESREKQFSQAESDYSKGIRIDPTDAVAYESRAELCLTHGDYAQAAKDFTAAMDVAPDSKPLILAKRAVAYDKMNRPDLAARDRKDSSATTKVKAAGTGG